MEHLCLIYFEGQALDAFMDEAFAYDEVLRKGGHYPVSGALQPNLSVDMTSVVKPWQQRFLRYHPCFLLVIRRDGASNDDGGSR
jgi:hypothetical protein